MSVHDTCARRQFLATGGRGSLAASIMGGGVLDAWGPNRGEAADLPG